MRHPRYIVTENSYFWPINHYIIVMSSYRPNELCSGNTVIPMIERFSKYGGGMAVQLLFAMIVISVRNAELVLCIITECHTKLHHYLLLLLHLLPPPPPPPSSSSFSPMVNSGGSGVGIDKLCQHNFENYRQPGAFWIYEGIIGSLDVKVAIRMRTT